MYTKPVICRVKLESGRVTENHSDMLPMGHCQVLSPLCPHQAQAVVDDIQQGLPCGYIRKETMGQKSVVDGFTASPHSLQIPHPRPSTYDAILSDHPQQSTNVPLAACLQGMRLTVARVRPTRPATVLYRMSSRTSANTPCLTPMELDGASLDQSVRIEKRYVIVDSNLSQCESKFGKMTTWAAGLDFDDPIWHWSESSAKVRPDFVGEQSQIYFMSISAQ